MSEPIDRREFVKRCVITGAGVLAGSSLSGAIERAVSPSMAMTFDLCAATGDRFFENTIRAVDAIGGMKRFVTPGKTVGLLINSPFDRRGAHTNPDIALAVMKMCVDSGAKQIFAINDFGGRYLRRSSQYDKLKSDADRIVYSDSMKEVRIENGRALKKAEVSENLLSCDVFINIPIIKDHEGTRFSCTMKNMMGACSSSTCRVFHFGGSSMLSIFKGYYSNVEVLAHSIADISLVRRPDLSVVDATEILVTNGPSGPGEINTPKEVIASTDGLAADMYATHHLGLEWQELLVIRYALEHGYGPKTLKEVKIRNI